MYDLKKLTVPENKKPEVICKYIDNQMKPVFLEMFTHASLDWSKEIIEDWKLVDIGETFFMYPSVEKEYRAKCWRGSVQTDALTYGVSLSCFCINHTAWWMSENVQLNQHAWDIIDSLNRQFYFLRDAVLEEKIQGVNVQDLLEILD